MTLAEFIAPLSKKTHQDRILAVLYYRERYEQKTALTVDEIRESLKSARSKGWAKVNVADVLSKSGALVDTGRLRGKRRLWNLTDSGREHVRALLGLPEADVEIEHDVGTLENLVTKISDLDVRDYLDEGLKCLQVGALRACTVFVWAAAIRTIKPASLRRARRCFRPPFKNTTRRPDPLTRSMTLPTLRMRRRCWPLKTSAF